jgi:hypothetical protein
MLTVASMTSYLKTDPLVTKFHRQKSKVKVYQSSGDCSGE